jgi:hypothetical protein
MSAGCFLKYAALAAGIQVGLVLLSTLVYFVGAFVYVYAPWVWLVEWAAGRGGPASHAMAGAQIVGGLLGFVAYTLLGGFVGCRLGGERRVR